MLQTPDRSEAELQERWPRLHRRREVAAPFSPLASALPMLPPPRVAIHQIRVDMQIGSQTELETTIK